MGVPPNHLRLDNDLVSKALVTRGSPLRTAPMEKTGWLDPVFADATMCTWMVISENEDVADEIAKKHLGKL